jgi:hypothetical protein
MKLTTRAAITAVDTVAPEPSLLDALTAFVFDVGTTEGDCEGVAETGDRDGFTVGFPKVGFEEGEMDIGLRDTGRLLGLTVGRKGEGFIEGSSVGSSDGESEGLSLGYILGSTDGSTEMLGCTEGFAVEG